MTSKMIIGLGIVVLGIELWGGQLISWALLLRGTEILCRRCGLIAAAA